MIAVELEGSLRVPSQPAAAAPLSFILRTERNWLNQSGSHRGGHMRVAFIGLAIIVVIGAILVFVGPRLISADEVRDNQLAQVETATGYRLRVSRPVSISLFPS